MRFLRLCIQQYTSLWTIYCPRKPVIVYREGTNALWLVSRQVLCSENWKKVGLLALAASEIIPVQTHLPSNVTILHHTNVLPGQLSAGTVELLLNRCVTSCRVQCNRNLILQWAFVALGTHLIAAHSGAASRWTEDEWWPDISFGSCLLFLTAW